MYQEGYPNAPKYDPDKRPIPAYYSSCDAHSQLMERQREELIKFLRNQKLLPRNFLDAEREFNDYRNEDNDEVDTKYYKELKKITEPYHKWESRKYMLDSYLLYMACYYWAPTFEITLAKLVCPNEIWRVREGKSHATVINEDNTKVFDLLFWSLDGRIENYMFGDVIVNPDPTLGGKEAYEGSSGSF